VVKGEVTISIADFQALLDSSINADEITKSTKTASREIQVFLSYLHTQLDLTPHIDSFNRQSTKSKIIIEDTNKIKIKFNEE
jgi:hypothetical protein|tara:strand:- start:1794 stop:2039 length:246 start_codon:yes stop_codon:yes gene_type:complete